MFDWNVGYYDPNTGLWVNLGQRPGPTYPGGTGGAYQYGVQPQNQQLLMLGLILLGAVLLLKD